MTINCNGRLVDLASPKILGILNLTPDSFFDGGHFQETSNAIKQCEKLLNEGADFIDLGAYSSRPGAKEVTEEEELNRLIPVLEALKKAFPTALFSIDTFRAKVAQESLDRGAAMINDISAGNLDAQMLSTVGQYSVPYIAMHMQGKPKTMQDNPTYTDLFSEMMHFFSAKLLDCRAAGIDDIILDPGFGFGKTMEHNFSLLKQFDRFQAFNCPVMAGISRKSMIYKTLGTDATDALNGSTVLHTVALLKKAQLLRVHDVKEAKECVSLLEQLQ